MRRRWILVTCLVLAAVVVTGGAVVALKVIIPQRAFDRSLFERDQPEQTQEPTFPEWKGLSLSELVSHVTAAPTDQPVQTPVDYDFSKKRINILVLGLDSSDERVAAGMNFRSDTIILVSVNFTDNTVDMLSVPRDTYTKIYNKDKRNKINSAFTFGGGAGKQGFEYAINTVSAFLGGIPIDYYVGFDMNVVKKTIDIMGGVWYDVDIAFTMCGRPLDKGYQLLTGQQVLDYCRWRYTTGGDIGRIDRQQRMLTTIFQQMKSTKQIKNIPDIYTAVNEGLYTNLESVQIAALANFMLGLGIENIDRHTVQGQSVMMNDVSYYVIYQEKKKQLIKDIFGVNITYDPEEDVEYVLEELERNKQELAAAITDSNALQEVVTALLASQDAQYVTAAEKTQLESGVARCADAVDMQTKDLIDTETASLRQNYEQVKSQISSRKSVRSNAAATLSTAQSKISQYESCMKPDEKAQIDQAVSALSTAISQGDYDSMETATAQVNSVGTPLFDSCQLLQAARESLDKTADIVDAMVADHDGLYIEDKAALNDLSGQARSLLSGYDTAAINAMDESLTAKAYECLDGFYAALKDHLSAWSQDDQNQCQELLAQIDEARAGKKLEQTGLKIEELYQKMYYMHADFMDLHKPATTPAP